MRNVTVNDVRKVMTMSRNEGREYLISIMGEEKYNDIRKQVLADMEELKKSRS